MIHVLVADEATTRARAGAPRAGHMGVADEREVLVIDAEEPARDARESWHASWPPRT